MAINDVFPISWTIAMLKSTSTYCRRRHAPILQVALIWLGCGGVACIISSAHCISDLKLGKICKSVSSLKCFCLRFIASLISPSLQIFFACSTIAKNSLIFLLFNNNFFTIKMRFVLHDLIMISFLPQKPFRWLRSLCNIIEEIIPQFWHIE